MSIRLFMAVTSALVLTGSLFAAQKNIIPTESEIAKSLLITPKDPFTVNVNINDSTQITQKKPAHGQRVIIGPENRIRFNDGSYPYRAIGKIRFGKDAGWICTATLVGPRHILTNSHCVDMKYPIYFYPSYNNGDYYQKTAKTTWAVRTYWGTGTSDTSSGTHTLPGNFSFANDWAVIVLNESAGNQFGWLGSKNFDNSWFNLTNAWVMVSYPNAGQLNEYGEYPLFQKDCIIHEDSSSGIQHDCDSNGGASGSSIWGTFPDGSKYVVALNNSSMNELNTENCSYYIKDRCANGAVRGDKFVPTIAQARKDYP